MPGATTKQPKIAAGATKKSAGASNAPQPTPKPQTKPAAPAKQEKAAKAPAAAAAGASGAGATNAKIQQNATFIKRRRTYKTVNQLEYQRRREAEKQRQRDMKRTIKDSQVLRAEQVVSKARRKMFATIRHTKRAKLGPKKVKADSLKVPDNVLLLVVRIHLPTLGVSPEVLKDLRFLRLGGQNTASLVPSTEPYRNALARVQSYVTYGVPTLKTVTDLFFKHGKIPRSDAQATKQNVIVDEEGETKSITSSDDRLTNAYIQKKLGKYDIVCIEDLIHELFTLGPNVSKCLSAFRYFQLKSPSTGWNESLSHLKFGGNSGYRGDEINELLKTMM